MGDPEDTLRAETVVAGDSETGASPSADEANVPPVRYAVDLFNAFGAVCDKAKSGAQSCQAVAAFVHERANIEAAYARALTKTAASANADDWALGFGKCWALVHETLLGLGKIHTESAAKMQSTMVAGARAFAAQQETQAQRLIAEGTKFRTVQANNLYSMERAKEKYGKRCAEALEVLQSMQADASSTPSTSTSGGTPSSLAPSPPSSTGISIEESKEIVGQLLNRMSSFAKPSMERQRSKLEACLEEVVAAEQHYTRSVDYFNSKQIILEREIAENLLAFQLTEEQRIEYLKDLLVRLQTLFLRSLGASGQLIESLRDGMGDINEFVDIEDGFRKLSQDIDADSEVLDPNDNAFYTRMCQVQAMSDRGHNVIRNFNSTLIDLMSIEDHFVSSTQRLLRAHDALSSTSGDLFNLSPALSQVINEGSTLMAGWQATKKQMQRFSQVRLEFRSLLAEPVALNIATMKQEYESARASTHESFSKSHSAICHDAAVHQKRKQKLDLKFREFSQSFASLPDMGEIDLRNLDIAQALVLIHQLSGAFNEKEKRTEAKLKVLGDEVQEAQQNVTDSLASLKQRSAQYIQDIDMFISAYMKNEKFRLQVEKSSLLSLTKALEHTVEGATACVKIALQATELIDPNKDVEEFILIHRKPRLKTKKFSVIHHPDDALKTAIDEYLRNRASLSPATTEGNMQSKNGDMKTHPSPVKPTYSTPSSTAPSEVASKSGFASIDEERDGHLMGVSDFQKQFKLESPEQVVESYSCALYANNFPNHGRMYLTSEHLCFSGWRDTVYVVSYLDITMIEKKNSAIIVPNALEITANGEKVFFTSFVFRDECLQCMLQLQAIKRATSVALADPPKPTIATEGPEMRVDAPTEVPSPTTEPPRGPAAETQGVALKDDTNRSNAEQLLSIPAPTPSRAIPSRDELLSDFELVVDEDVPFSVEFAYKTIWVESPSFLERFLKRGGETLISITPWDQAPVTYTAISKPDVFQGSRRVSYTHNKKYMVGPSSIPTTQSQRFKWEPDTRLVISVTTVVSDAPYCDYFRAENRWVISNTAKEGVCKLQVGISVQWLKSTWLKKQIESTAMGEAKEYTRALVNAAIEEARSRSSSKHPSSPFAPATCVQSAAVDALTIQPLATNGTPGTTSLTNMSEKTRIVDMQAPSPVAPPLQDSAITRQQPYPVFSLLQVANGVCLLVFFYTMYRIGSALDEMRMLTRETLVQQRQQQEIFREILLKLQGQRNNL